MPFIFYSENTQGACFRFLENGDEKRVETFPTKRLGRVVQGNLALQVFEDRDYRRITFADPRNVMQAAAKKLGRQVGFGWAGSILGKALKGYKILSSNDLCHFDFNQKEIAEGKKLMRFESMLSMLGGITLMCYDFSSYTGCAYCFPDYETARRWAEVLEIRQYFLYNTDDKFMNMMDFQD